MQEYNARNGKVQFKPSLEEAERADEEQAGFCLACGNQQSGCEPDMRRGTCESCGADKLYGAAELVLMGIYHE